MFGQVDLWLSDGVSWLKDDIKVLYNHTLISHLLFVLQMKSIAIICARGIGDGLTWMVIAHQLYLNQYQVTVYSDILSELSDWFPNIEIKHNPEDILEFNAYDIVLSDDHSIVVRQPEKISTQLIIPREHFFNRNIQRIHNMHYVLKTRFQISTQSKKNGLVPTVQKRVDQNPYIVIHPTASNSNRNWGGRKFVSVARAVMNMGYNVSFIMHKSEIKDWLFVQDHGINLPEFDSLSDTAEHIYNASYFIGSDSGLGHLASNLGVPTISIFVRKSHSLNWRPGWSNGIVVSPLNPLPGRYLRQKYWRIFITPSMVIRSFKKIKQV